MKRIVTLLIWCCLFIGSFSCEVMGVETNEFSFVLKPSAIAGVGLFATHEISKGTIIRFFPKGYEPRLLHKNDIPQDFLHYCIAKENDMWVCPRDFGHMMIAWHVNHSFTPNIKHIESPGICVTLCNIKQGDELTMDYNDFDEPEDCKEDYYKK